MLVRPRWSPRSAPLAAVAVLGRGPIGDALLRRAGERDDAGLHALRGVRSARGVCLLGPTELLPWADGCSYLGRDPAAPRLLLPTTLAPDVPLDVLERALLARAGAGLWAVGVEPPILLAVGAALPLDRARIEAAP